MRTSAMGSILKKKRLTSCELLSNDQREVGWSWHASTSGVIGMGEREGSSEGERKDWEGATRGGPNRQKEVGRGSVEGGVIFLRLRTALHSMKLSPRNSFGEYLKTSKAQGSKSCSAT